MLDIGTGILSRLTFDARDQNGTWSPDGKQIVFASPRQRSFDLYRKILDGEEKLFFASDDHKFSEAWLHDGTIVYITANGKRLARLSTSAEPKTSVLVEDQFQRMDRVFRRTASG